MLRLILALTAHPWTAQNAWNGEFVSVPVARPPAPVRSRPNGSTELDLSLKLRAKMALR